jgi:hypothetical protein
MGMALILLLTIETVLEPETELRPRGAIVPPDKRAFKLTTPAD